MRFERFIYVLPWSEQNPLLNLNQHELFAFHQLYDIHESFVQTNDTLYITNGWTSGIFLIIASVRFFYPPKKRFTILLADRNSRTDVLKHSAIGYGALDRRESSVQADP